MTDRSGIVHPVLRRVGVVLALVAFFATPAVAAAPEGPRLAIVAHDSCCGAALISVAPDGQKPSLLFAPEGKIELVAGDRPSWSADGQLLAFDAFGDFPEIDSKAFGSGWPAVATVRADGSGARVYPRAFLNAGEPLIAPDGRAVVFQRVKLVKILPGRESYLFKTAIWRLDLRSGSVKRLTRWRLAAFLEPGSFSPDGSTLAATLRDRQGERVVAIDLRSRRFSPLIREASEPLYSPDGTRLAVVHLERGFRSLPEPDRPVSELLVGNADGSGVKRLLRRRGYISWPSWDPSGARVSFSLNPPGVTGGLDPEPGNAVLAINADGTCLTKVFSDPGLTLYGSAWQPGPGREAGPISC